jgi:hypothetical protein
LELLVLMGELLKELAASGHGFLKENMQVASKESRGLARD